MLIDFDADDALDADEAEELVIDDELVNDGVDVEVAVKTTAA